MQLVIFFVKTVSFFEILVYSHVSTVYILCTHLIHMKGAHLYVGKGNTTYQYELVDVFN